MNELSAYLKAQNEKTAAWVAEDPTNRWASGLVEDLAHWAQYGITTPAELEHYFLATEVYEAHKDVFGFKPSWQAVNSLSDARLRVELESLVVLMKEDRQEAEAEELAHKLAMERAMTPKTGWSIGELVGA